MINIDSCEGFIRVYKEGKSFEDEDPYMAIMSFHGLSSETMFISGLMGALNRKVFTEFIIELKKKGFKRILGYFPTAFRPKAFKPLPKTDLYMMELN